MKIQKISDENIGNVSLSDSKLVANRMQHSFGEQLRKVEGELAQQKLENLFVDIQKQGKVLGETLNIKDMRKYKDLIQKFLDSAVKKMYSIKDQKGWDRRGRHKIYSMVETVNKELENLTKMLLEEQKDKIEILAKVDEIRGMLVDIYS